MLKILLRMYVALKGRKRYTFQCPQCYYYRMSVNNLEVLDQLILVHNYAFHGEEGQVS